MICHPFAVKPGTGGYLSANKNKAVGWEAYSSAKNDELVGGRRRKVVRNKLREAVGANYRNFDHCAISTVLVGVKVANS